MKRPGHEDIMKTYRIFSALVSLVILGSALSALSVVDLRPRVDSDFFFSTDDPELQASQHIDRLFPSQDQLLISATAPDIADADYVGRVDALTTALEGIDGVASVQSITRGPSSPTVVADSPIWSRLLLGQSPHLTQLLVFLEDAQTDPAEASTRLLEIEDLLEQHHRAGFALGMSGVPYVIELVRRSLGRDLRVFSTAALVMFGLLIALIYRSWRIVLGTLVTCLGACVTALVVLALMGSSIGLLTANIITIVFVLTLSHIVFLTANWRRATATDADAGTALRTAIARTLEASIWCMATTLLGFGSLLLASAKPLRELGSAGAVGTLTALVVAFGIYPLFLKRAPRPGIRAPASPGPQGRELGKPITLVLMLTVILALPGLWSLNTDPNLLSYFADDSELREGLERIDRNGGSTPMLMVVATGDGGRLDSNEAQERMSRLQQALDDDPEVGTALSLPVLLAEAKRVPMAFLLGWSQLLDILESPAFGNVAAGFVTPDRTQGLYFLRMRESDRQSPRAEVVQRLTAAAAEHGLEARLVGGLYPLQASLGALVSDSLIRGLGGLLVLFAVIAALISRSPSLCLAMILSLAAVPVLLLGTLGHWGAPIDIISSPAANVAIALGIDSMIHLITAVRRRARRGDSLAVAWQDATETLRSPILGAACILAGGFGIFVLSSFPPTARFGISVAGGTLLAACVALWVLPYLSLRLQPAGRES